MKVRIEYTVGQYMPTEYRRAVCAVLASALWEYTREHCMPPLNHETVERNGFTYQTYGPVHMTAGDWLRAHFRQQFGKAIALRWFS